MIWRSTTFRFAALVFVCQIVTAVVLLVGLGMILRTQSTASATNAAETMRADLLATLAEGGPGTLARAVDLRAEEEVAQDAVMLLVDASGRRIAGNLGAWPPSAATDGNYASVDLYRIGHDAPEAMLVRTTPLPNGQRLLTGIVVESDLQLLKLLERASLLILLLALIFATLVSWLAARLIVGRLETTVATLQAVREGALEQRVPADPSRDAFATLGDEVNRTLDRVETLIGELQIATDGLAHDLKSPLTRLRVALEQAASQVTEPAAGEAIERALNEGERLRSLVETALSISRAEAGIGRESMVEADLGKLLETIAEIYEPLVEEDGRAITVDAPVPVKWQIHRQLLEQALGNLVDNAIKYGAGTITLSVVAEADAVTIAVADQGEGISADQREEALRRFGRLDVARRGTGAGLGLSLVQAVAHLHDGKVELGDARPGLVVAIRLR